ncbi:nickel pincer cofactor biosynthesis protein LarB [Anaerophilus nitritogenes]|uniref:nickel pincer cofactor biosynthesis protein LarB n=1 Tax=Anaerophilus nitritogenes TaxID=2498136 RepID=UPI001FA96D1C|nr:nickel pincer cofactor biosynthesis protein LarB [Anaerophilus nitritogenes]
MELKYIENILQKVKSGSINVEEAMNHLKNLPFEDMGYAKIDHHRSLRNGYPEVIYCEGKSIDHIYGIVENMLKKDTNILATRANEEIYQSLKNLTNDLVYNPLSKTLVIQRKKTQKYKGKIVIATGGTSDIPVAEEAYVTADILGNQVQRLYDVGVAGIHRLLANTDILMNANVIIAVAGMEGALASVIGGLVDKPVIAVPTSVGYGAHFNGLAPLLAMLNSCASGIGVVNIDNGFGAAYLASTINRQIELARKE